ncbi:MAG: chalcone isomerase family protein [Gammaproteobacteria bacterium]|nr:chalcone isomerase family protein [Gammaproteobacteria bacterium]
MKKAYLAVIMLAFLQPVQAVEIAGRQFEDVITIADYPDKLQLNGVGIRYKFFFKIYIAVLYLQEKNKDVKQIIESVQARRMVMYFLYDRVEKEKLVASWLEGFEANLSAENFRLLEPRIQSFNNFFETVESGDVVLLDFIPGMGTRVTIKGQQKGIIEGADFYSALLKIWLGDEPIDDDLKSALTGND